jgi:hypothetical protein
MSNGGLNWIANFIWGLLTTSSAISMSAASIAM